MRDGEWGKRLGQEVDYSRKESESEDEGGWRGG